MHGMILQAKFDQGTNKDDLKLVNTNSNPQQQTPRSTILDVVQKRQYLISHKKRESFPFI